MKRPQRTFIVPVVHHLTFGVEVQVEAHSLAEARRLAVLPNASIMGDGYDWNRQDFTKATVGGWRKIEATPAVLP